MDPELDKDPMDTSVVKLQEGAAINFFNALYEKFGGEITEDSFRVENATVRIRLNSYEAAPGMELMISEAWFEKDLIQIRQSDGDLDSVHIYMVLEGATSQSFNDRDETLAAGTLKGAFAYNGLFPMRILHPANQGLRSIAVKIRKDTIKILLPEAFDLFTEMFSDPEGVAYHAQIPSELEKLCKELYHYRDVEFGNRSMVIARGIEILTVMFDVIRKRRAKKQLNGLHADDFERLQRIKDHILGRIDERISLEDLASEFGISVSKLKRDFRSLFDHSVYQFYTHARMDEAYRRLKSGKYSVMEVGYDLGYQNLSKFSEMFKKVKGLSPSEVI